MDSEPELKRTFRGFVNYAYGDLPRTVFGKWTVWWFYIVPFCIVILAAGEKELLITVPPKFEDLKVVEGKAEITVDRSGRLLIHLRDRSVLHSGCALGRDYAPKLNGKRAKAWLTSEGRVLQAEVDGRVWESCRYERLLKNAMDTSGFDTKMAMIYFYIFLILIVLPYFTLTKLFESQT